MTNPSPAHSKTVPSGKVVYSTRVVANQWATVQTIVDARVQVAQDVAMALYTRLLNGKPALCRVETKEWTEGQVDHTLTFIQHRAYWTPQEEIERN